MGRLTIFFTWRCEPCVVIYTARDSEGCQLGADDIWRFRASRQLSVFLHTGGPDWLRRGGAGLQLEPGHETQAELSCRLFECDSCHRTRGASLIPNMSFNSRDDSPGGWVSVGGAELCTHRRQQIKAAAQRVRIRNEIQRRRQDGVARPALNRGSLPAVDRGPTWILR